VPNEPELTFSQEALGAVQLWFELAQRHNAAAKKARDHEGQLLARKSKMEAVLRAILACPKAVNLQLDKGIIFVTAKSCCGGLHIPCALFRKSVMEGFGLGLLQRGIILERLQECGLTDVVLNSIGPKRRPRPKSRRQKNR
jgi:hypothetical protein